MLCFSWKLSCTWMLFYLPIRKEPFSCTAAHTEPNDMAPVCSCILHLITELTDMTPVCLCIKLFWWWWWIFWTFASKVSDLPLLIVVGFPMAFDTVQPREWFAAQVALVLVPLVNALHMPLHLILGDKASLAVFTFVQSFTSVQLFMSGLWPKCCEAPCAEWAHERPLWIRHNSRDEVSWDWMATAWPGKASEKRLYNTFWNFDS